MHDNKAARLGRRTVLAASAAALAMPAVARAQANPLKIGIQSIFSGPIALLGTSSRGAIQPEIDRINAAGGLLGRQIQPIYRDSKGQPQEAARVARELVNTDGCEILLDAEASSGAYAVQEVVRDLGVLCVHSNSETSSLTADPKLRVATAFRSARQGVHDAIVGGAHSAKVATAKKLSKWATCSPDYAFGRDTTAQFLEFLKHFKPDIEVLSQGWPKLGAPDFTEVITKILQAKPQALYSALYAGDLSAFVNQGNVYALFSAMQVFVPAMGDLPVLTAVKNLPAGIQSANRYLPTFPATAENAAWGAAYRKNNNNDYPTNWSWENSTAIRFIEAAVKKAGSTDGKKAAAALEGLTIDSPFSTTGKVTMRAEDHTLIDYAIGWGTTVPKEPFVIDMEPGDWGQIAELEKEWKKSNGYI
ncbi:MAG TPA: ABC transporter substrate-binding protein [Acetobacteraceae bacterium]|jgi:branched-chain amino acid transport system substrate-binding protein|nr:ABC transporter substrate-binding protein [Acetobacteraceae bacterium]